MIGHFLSQIIARRRRARTHDNIRGRHSTKRTN